MAAFERVIRKAGIGAAIDWSIISMNETTAVRGPNDLRYSITTVVSSFDMVAKAVLRLFLKSAKAKYTMKKITMPATAIYLSFFLLFLISRISSSLFSSLRSLSLASFSLISLSSSLVYIF